MKLMGERLIPLPQQRVWERLNDPLTLQQSIPGCEALTQVSPEEFHVQMLASVGPVKAKFRGKLFLADVDAPHAYTLRFEGNGGAAGFGNGVAQVRIAPAAGGTRLTYEVAAQVGGKLAQVGARLVQGVAEKLAEEFFTRFVADIAPQEADRQPGASPDTSISSAPGSASERKANAPARRRAWVLTGTIATVLLAAIYQFAT